MTLQRFQYLLKKVNPRLRVRIRGYGDIAGLFAGVSGKSGYIARLTKGELTLVGYRIKVLDPTAAKAGVLNYTRGKIMKRGRKTLVTLLRSWRWIKTPAQASMLLWGIEPKGGDNDGTR